MAPHSSTLASKIPWTEEPVGLQSMGALRVGHDWATSLSLFTFMYGRRNWQPTPLFLPGESQGQESLVGCCLWVAQSRTRLKQLSSSMSFHGRIAHFFLSVNNIPLVGCTTVCLFIHLLRDILIASKTWQWIKLLSTSMYKCFFCFGGRVCFCFCLFWVFAAVQVFLLLRCMAFSLWWLFLVWSTGSIVVAHGLSCPTSCGIFPDPGLKLCLLHWQADSLPLSHQGSTVYKFLHRLKFSIHLGKYQGVQLLDHMLCSCFNRYGKRSK